MRSVDGKKILGGFLLIIQAISSFQRTEYIVRGDAITWDPDRQDLAAVLDSDTNQILFLKLTQE